MRRLFIYNDKENKLTELIMMRHGQTEANIKRIYGGRIDLPLAEEGKQEAARTAKRLPAFDYVYASDMLRTQQTAQIVAPKADIKYNAALREMDFGDYEGLSADEIQARMPGSWQRYLVDHQTFTFPNGSNVEEFVSKAAETVKSIAVAHDEKSVLVVTHKGFILSVLSKCLHGDSAHLFHYDIRPGGFLRLHIEEGFAVLKQLC